MEVQLTTRCVQTLLAHLKQPATKTRLVVNCKHYEGVTSRVLLGDLLRQKIDVSRVEAIVMDLDAACCFCVVKLLEAGVRVTCISCDFAAFGHDARLDLPIATIDVQAPLGKMETRERVDASAEALEIETALVKVLRDITAGLRCAFPELDEYEPASEAFAAELARLLRALPHAERRVRERHPLADVAVLRCLARRLHVDEAFEFLDRVARVATPECGKKSAWLQSDELDVIVAAAKKRVFASSQPDAVVGGLWRLERPPKRHALRRALGRRGTTVLAVDPDAVVSALLPDDAFEARFARWILRDDRCFVAKNDEALRAAAKDLARKSFKEPEVTVLTVDQWTARDAVDEHVVAADEAATVRGTPVHVLAIGSLEARCVRSNARLEAIARRAVKLPAARGVRPAKRRRTIKVDERELRSPLPRALHEAGFDLDLSTLQSADFVVGAYGVERKSPADLAHSLENGRLWNQLRELKRRFARPLLLIEFPDGHTYPVAEPGDHVSSRSFQAKLAKLALEFPTVRFCWSPHPTSTADLFAALPNTPESHEADDDDIVERVFAKVIPNCPAVGVSLRDLANMGRNELEALVGSPRAFDLITGCR